MSNPEKSVGNDALLDQPIVAMYRTPLDIYSSQSSLYSADGGQGDYGINGSVLLGIWHNNETLFVRVVKAKNLPGAKAGGLSDPYVKTYLLPDHSKFTKRKTTIQRKTNDPIYNEILKNKLERLHLSETTLLVSVWDWERFGRNLFLGEVQLQLSSLNLTNSDDRWYRLHGKKPEPENEERGTLVVSIMYSPYEDQDKGSLFIKIKEAKNLLQMNPQGLADSAVRIFLLPKQNPFTKKKTEVIKSTLNPVWNEEFEYKYVTLEELKCSRVLELSVWDYDRRGCNDYIGCVRLGPTPDESNTNSKDWMDSTDSEARHWADMLAHPGRWEEASHALRPSIASRFSEYPSNQNETDFGLDSADEEESDEDQLNNDGSNISLYSESETRGDQPITGKLQVRLEYKESNLLVHIQKAEDLAAADSNGYSDPYVKVFLLPDRTKRTKRKTKVKRKTLNPVFNETIQYPVKESELSSHTLFFSVWDWDRFGKNEFLGETKVPLSDSNVNGCSHWYNLSDNLDVGNESHTENAPSTGKLTIGLKLEEINFKRGEMHCDLHVYVRNGKDLPNRDNQGYTDGFVKMYLLPSKTSKMKRRTKVVKDNLNPTWDEHFVYNKVTAEQLSSRHALEIVVWDHDVLSSNDFVGGLRIGPAPNPGQTYEWMDSTTSETNHWEEMLSRRGEWVECCHVLRPSMNYRNVSTTEPSTNPETPGKEENEAITEPTISVKEQELPSGDLIVSAMFEVAGKDGRTTGTLHVMIKEAHQLQCKTTGGIFAKYNMLPQEMFSSKNKTQIIKNTADPVWEYSFTYDKQFLDELVAEQVLEITLWDNNDESILVFVGGIRLGPDPAANSTRYLWMDSSGEEIKHWEAIFASPGKWVEMKHSLRPTMSC